MKHKTKKLERCPHCNKDLKKKRPLSGPEFIASQLFWGWPLPGEKTAKKKSHPPTR